MKMGCIILACDSLRLHVEAAQAKMGTCHGVRLLDSTLHAWPEKMNEAVFEAIAELPPQVDTVLLAMGLCGGSVSGKPVPRRTVIPKVDDCITLLLHRDQTWHPDLKECGHFYLTDTLDSRLSIENMHRRLREDYGEQDGMEIFNMWFASYESVDIIDTGAYDCRSAEYVEKARRQAALVNCPLTYVDGSNLLLEKLVSGQWDHQFIVAEKGQVLDQMDFSTGTSGI